MQHCAYPPVPVCDQPESPDCQPPGIEAPTARIVFFVLHSALRKSAAAEAQQSESVRHHYPRGESQQLRTVDEVPDLGAVRPPSRCKGISGGTAHGFLAVGALERQAGVRQALDVRRLHEGHVVSREIWPQVIEDDVPAPVNINLDQQPKQYDRTPMQKSISAARSRESYTVRDVET